MALHNDLAYIAAFVFVRHGYRLAARQGMETKQELHLGGSGIVYRASIRRNGWDEDKVALTTQ
jgi:hypothetical protein